MGSIIPFIRFMIDNITVMANVNHMGGTKQLCNSVTQEMWHDAKNEVSVIFQE